jgi:cytoskeletal protein RodZ
MRASRYLISAVGWSIAGLVASVSPGCGCPRTEPSPPTAEVAEKTDDMLQPVQTTPSDPSREREKEAEKSDSATGPSKPTQQGEATETTDAPNAQGDSSTNASNASGTPKKRKAPTKPTGNPQDAKRRAKELSAAASKSAGKGNYAKAFREARKGWETASGFPNDGECRVLTQTLLRQMAQFGARANAEVKRDSSKTLIIE